MRKIILVNGLARSGKDTVANFLAECFDKNEVERMAFAEPVKREVREIWKPVFDLINEKIERFAELRECASLVSSLKTTDEMLNKGEVKNELTRMFYQIHGTEVRRGADDKYWIKLAVKKIKESDKKVFIISDFRFDNEYFDLKEFLSDSEGNLFYTVKVNRKFKTTESAVSQSHASENGIAKDFAWDYIIENDLGLSELKEKSKQLSIAIGLA